MMNMKDVRDLIDLIRDTDVVEAEVERAGVRIRVRREPGGGGPHAAHVATTSAAAAAAPVPAPAPGAAPAAEPEAGLPENVSVVVAPLVGRFYRSSSPDAAPYVEVGDRVKKGQVLCIIEAMKLMNEIESEHAGVVRAVRAENGRPVEFGEPLFEIERAE